MTDKQPSITPKTVMQTLLVWHENEVFFPAELKQKLEIDDSDDGHQAAHELANALEALRDKGYVDWSILDGIKGWHITDSGKEWGNA